MLNCISGRPDDSQCDVSISEEIRHNSVVQTLLMSVVLIMIFPSHFVVHILQYD